MTKYDVGYNLTEEVRQLQDADHKKDFDTVLTAKVHIYQLFNREDDLDLNEYTDEKNKITVDFWKIHDERIKGEKTEQLILQLYNDIQSYIQGYNIITDTCRTDIVKSTMDLINGNRK